MTHSVSFPILSDLGEDIGIRTLVWFGFWLLCLAAPVHAKTAADYRIVPGGKRVQRFIRAMWEELSVAPAPGFRYRSVCRDWNGSLALVLEGKGQGFDFFRSDGTLVRASEIEWISRPEGELVDVTCDPDRAGFLGITADGRRWELRYHGRDWKFEAREQSAEPSAPAASEARKAPLDRLLPYPDFEQTLQGLVARIPDLEPLWRLAEADPTAGRKIYLGGGVLRGLLKWMASKMEEVGPKALESMVPPSSRELLINPDGDRDLWVPDGYAKKLEGTDYEEGWDLIEQSFRKASVMAGGTTLEKTGVSPWGVEDPLEGLKSFHSGELVFKEATPESFAASNATGRLLNNSRTALALRFLRFEKEFPDLSISAKSLEAVRKIAGLEKASLPRQPNWWILKAARRLAETSPDAPFATLGTLKRYGLIRLLADAGYTIGTKIESVRAGTVSPEQAGLTGDDFQDVDRLLGQSPEMQLELKRRFLPLLTSPRQFERLFKLRNRPWGYEKTMELLALWQSAEKRFFAEGGTEVTADRIRKELRASLEESSRFDGALRALEKILPGVDSAQGYLDALELYADGEDSVMRLAREKAVEKTYVRFLRLKPTLDQIARLEARGVGSVEVISRVKFVALKKAATPEEFLQAIQYHVALPTQALKEAVDTLFMKLMARYFSLRPTLAQVLELDRSVISKIASGVELKRRAMDLVGKPDDYLMLFEPYLTGNRYHPLYKQQLVGLVDDTIDFFLALEPDAAARSRLMALLPLASPARRKLEALRPRPPARCAHRLAAFPF